MTEHLEDTSGIDREAIAKALEQVARQASRFGQPLLAAQIRHLASSAREPVAEKPEGD